MTKFEKLILVLIIGFIISISLFSHQDILEQIDIINYGEGYDRY
jgi:hypothetical protein